MIYKTELIIVNKFKFLLKIVNKNDNFKMKINIFILKQNSLKNN